MTLDFTDTGRFTIDMEAYLDKILRDLPEEFNGVAATPAADHLFKTRDNATKLDQEKADVFIG